MGRYFDKKQNKKNKAHLLARIGNIKSAGGGGITKKIRSEKSTLLACNTRELRITKPLGGGGEKTKNNFKK